MEQQSKKALPFFGVGKILPFVKKYKWIIFLMIGCGLIGSLVDIVVPIYQRYALNHFVGEHTLDTLALFIVIYTLSIIIAGVANYISCAYAMRVEVSMNRDLRNAAFSHLQTLAFSYYNQNSVGYIHARIMSDTSRIGTLVSWTMMDGV